MGNSCCAPTKKVCAPKKSIKKHELDSVLEDEAKQILVKDYLKLAEFKDGKRLFKFPLSTTAKNKAIGNIEEALNISI